MATRLQRWPRAARTSAGPKYKRIGFLETCEALKKSGRYRSKLEGRNRGRGVTSGFWFNGGNQSSATVNIHPEGSVSDSRQACHSGESGGG